MQTHIIIDDRLMNEALRVTGLKGTEEVIEMALRELIEHHHKDALAQAFGRLPWDGDLDSMRMDP